MGYFKENVKKKIVENLISVKVWTIFALLGVSTTLVCFKIISGDVWGAVNGGVISTVFACREAFKIQKIKSHPDEKINP